MKVINCKYYRIKLIRGGLMRRSGLMDTITYAPGEYFMVSNKKLAGEWKLFVNYASYTRRYKNIYTAEAYTVFRQMMAFKICKNKFATKYLYTKKNNPEIFQLMATHKKNGSCRTLVDENSFLDILEYCTGRIKDLYDL